MWQFLQAPMLGGPALIRHLCAPAAGCLSRQFLQAPMLGGSALNRSSQAVLNAILNSQRSPQAPTQLPTQRPAASSQKPQVTPLNFSESAPKDSNCIAILSLSHRFLLANLASAHAGWLGLRPKLPSSPQCSSQLARQLPSSQAAPSAAPNSQKPKAPNDINGISESFSKGPNCIATPRACFDFLRQILLAPMLGGLAQNRRFPRGASGSKR